MDDVLPTVGLTMPFLAQCEHRGSQRLKLK